MTHFAAAGGPRLTRWYWIAPYVAVGVFALTMLVLVAWLQQTERDSQRISVGRDVHWAGHTLREHLQANEEFLLSVSRHVVAARSLTLDSQQRASQFFGQHPELLDLVWQPAGEGPTWSASQSGDPLELTDLPRPPPQAFVWSGTLAQTHYVVPDESGSGTGSRLELWVPVWRGQTYLGAWTATYSTPRLLRDVLPPAALREYRFSLLPDSVAASASASAPMADEVTGHAALGPVLEGWSLHATTLPTQGWLVRALPTAMIVSLSLIILWSLWLLRAHVRRRVQVENERDLLFNLSLDLLCALDLSGRFRRCNPAFERILGYPPSSLHGQSLLDLLHDDDRPQVALHLAELSRGQAASFEVRGRCQDGSYKWLVWSINPVLAEGVVYGVAHDISSRKATEDALRAESAFRKAMEESVVTGLRAIDLSGRIIYVNSAFCRLVGFSESELLGAEPPFPYWPEDTFELCRANLDMSLAGAAPAGGFEMRIQRKTGERIDTRFYLSPLIDLNGKQTGWMASITDITEPKRVRAALEEAHQRFETVLDSLEAAVFVADAGTDEILFANRAFKYIHGFDAVGRTTRSVALPQPDRARYPLALANLKPQDLPLELFDGELQHPLSGRWFHVREHATPWVDGRVVRMGMATDITDRKQSAEVTREQAERLQHTSRLVTMGEMASSLAHELNQPLAAISNYCMGSVTRLQSGHYREAEVLAAMQKASLQAERAGKIIRRVREFVKKSEPRRRALHLSSVLEDAIAFVDMAARRMPGHIELEIPEALPAMYADQIMIEQVLINLISNGLEAMQDLPEAERRLVVRAWLLEAEAQVCLEVVDRGHGIDEEQRKQMFSPFYTTKNEGMGLGLNICRSIIEFHDSSLKIDSNPEGGTIFSFCLPVAVTSGEARRNTEMGCSLASL